MSAAIIFPILPEGRLASATLGQLVPAATAPGNELRRILPPALVVALDRIGDQIGEEVFEPLLHAASVEQLARTFERVFPKFRDYYASTIFIVWGWLQEDPQRFSALTIRGFQESEHLIRSHGPRWIGPDASLNALHGLATITRIAKAAAELLDKQGAASLRANEPEAEASANALIAYVMAFSAVRASLAALADGQAPPAKLENVAALANWSKSYAVNSYHLAKAAGLLKAVRSGAPVGRSDEEDLVLAEAGLESYAEGLAQDDQP
jgi:hypothetical protein